MKYREFLYDVSGKPAFANEIVVAYLSEAGFDSFSEDNRSISCYIPAHMFNTALFAEANSLIEQAIGNCPFQEKEIPDINWNKEWETHFEPVLVHDFCMVRAPFHTPNSTVKYDVVIQPKMSFGTGHHETTYLILEYMSTLNFRGKSVADCGCGTGVLALVAALDGAGSVYAFDYDTICYENTIENCALNNCEHILVEHGELSLLQNRTFDYLLANINRNILTQNMTVLANSLQENGLLIMSGFYEQDVPIIQEYALQNKLKFVYFKAKNKWSITVFSK